MTLILRTQNVRRAFLLGLLPDVIVLLHFEAELFILDVEEVLPLGLRAVIRCGLCEELLLVLEPEHVALALLLA